MSKKRHFIRFNKEAGELEVASIYASSAKKINYGFKELQIDRCCGKIDIGKCIISTPLGAVDNTGAMGGGCAATITLSLDGLDISDGSVAYSGTFTDDSILGILNNHFAPVGQFFFDSFNILLIFVPKTCGNWNLTVNINCDR
jgi:hypothetical protein